jgi:hypothetical protein
MIRKWIPNGFIVDCGFTRYFRTRFQEQKLILKQIRKDYVG